jgi:hypothetical protein
MCGLHFRLGDLERLLQAGGKIGLSRNLRTKLDPRVIYLFLKMYTDPLGFWSHLCILIFCH